MDSAGTNTNTNTDNTNNTNSRMVKRPRVMAMGLSRQGASSSSSTKSVSKSMLLQLLEERRWEEAMDRAAAHPTEVSESPDPSPLAIACRLGAPCACVKALLNIAPEKIRHVLNSRGTPLHEAMMCEDAGIDVIAALLQADEALENYYNNINNSNKDFTSSTTTSSSRATLLQDVDGFTPLHLFIRRRFQFHILQPEEDSSLLQMLELLVTSCPEAVIVPDKGEYEEPPIVYAIKAHMYAPSLGSEDETLSRVERKIYEMVDCMLKHYPQAASQVFNGYRGQYTALHSAVFHGRCTDTIRLLLETEQAYASRIQNHLLDGSSNNNSSKYQKPALLGNTQGEIPLHFCAMRGERPKSVDLIARAAPQGVLKRDASGLTPFHWLWIRFVSSMLALDEGGRGSDTTIQAIVDPNAPETNRYKQFWSLEQNDFDLDLHLSRRMDPPVDFLRMRHIPPEVQDANECLHWAGRVADVLIRLRETHDSRTLSVDGITTTIWNRQEVVTSLFWNKVVSLLEAFVQVADSSDNCPRGDSILVHTAFASPCCVPAVALIAASIFPQELSIPDQRGRLPLHYAASRRWIARDWPRDDGLNHEPIAAARILQHEALGILHTAIELSAPNAVRHVDKDNRLVLHHVINTFVQACTCSTPSSSSSSRNQQTSNSYKQMLDVVDRLVALYPDSLQRRDGVSMLYPFLQATAVATEVQDQLHWQQEVLPLSITFRLLRQNPTIL